MKILLYEFLTAGGWQTLSGNEPAPSSLVREGAAMLSAIARDFAKLQHVEVSFLSDPVYRKAEIAGCNSLDVSRHRGERIALQKFAAEADWTLVIAPEFDGILLDRCESVLAWGGRLLGPSPDVIAIAADKQRTADWLATHGLPVPAGRLVRGGSLPRDFSYPAVLKPRDGAGSQGLALVKDPEQHQSTAEQRGRELRIEGFCPGTAASVALLCGAAGQYALLPCRQHLSTDGTFRYLGGSLPLENELEKRASRLAIQAVATLAKPRGYIGVDLVLGPTPADDVVIEINPRLTTSYAGLRKATTENIAAAMLAVAGDGTSPPPIIWNRRPLRFSPDGKVSYKAVSHV